MPCGVQVGGGEDVCQRVVVCPHLKRCECQVLLEVFHYAPLKHEELQLRAVVVLFCRCQGMTPKSNGVVKPVLLLLGKYHYLEVSVSRRNGLSKSRNTNTRADWIFSFKTLTTSHTSGGSCTGPILTSFPRTSYRGLAMCTNPLMKHR